MEKFANGTFLYGVIDVTATEVCDHLLGGVVYVGSVGPLNFCAIDTLPAQYAGRNLRRHNPHETLMRTTAAESRPIGSWIAEKLNRCDGPVCFLIPEKGSRRCMRRANPLMIPSPMRRCSRRFVGHATDGLTALPVISTTPSFPMRWCKTGDLMAPSTATSRMKP
jgi:uncharacterized protein (UPF0261 family)